MNVELRHLRYFVALADELNFSRAAHRARISQQTLSAQIRRLEDELGVQLFYRTTRQVRLTPAGEGLIEDARQALSAVDDLLAKARRSALAQTGVLRLGYSPSTSFGVAAALLHAIRERRPGVEIQARESTSAAIVRDVRAGVLDVGVLRWLDPEAGVMSELLGREPIGVLVPAGHRLAGTDTVDVRALAGERFLLYPRQGREEHHDALLAVLAPVREEVELTLTVPDRSFTDVRLGRGIALVPRSIGRAAPTDLRWTALAGSHAAAPVRVIWSADGLNPAARTLLELAREHARREGWR
jgi:DNA-binding transcriptional LysR family regulator